METKDFLPRIAAFCCFRSAYLAADRAVREGICYPENLEIIRVPCAGKVDVLYLLKAFETGFDGVMVVGCQEEACQDLTGNIRAKNRVAFTQGLLAEIGLEKERLEMFHVTFNQAPRFAQVAQNFTETVKMLGPVAGRKEEGVGR